MAKRLGVYFVFFIKEPGRDLDITKTNEKYYANNIAPWLKKTICII